MSVQWARPFRMKKSSWMWDIKIWMALLCGCIRRRNWLKNNIIPFFVRKTIGQRILYLHSKLRIWELTWCVLFRISVPRGIAKASLTWHVLKCWPAVCPKTNTRWWLWTDRPDIPFPMRKLHYTVVTRRCCKSLRPIKREKWYSSGMPSIGIWKPRKARIRLCRNKEFMAEVMDTTAIKIKLLRKWRCWPTVLCIVRDRLCMWKVLHLPRNRTQPMWFRTNPIQWLCTMRTIRKWDGNLYVPMNSVRLRLILLCLPLVWTESFL